jgi:hypothetical protein
MIGERNFPEPNRSHLRRLFSSVNLVLAVSVSESIVETFITAAVTKS